MNVADWVLFCRTNVYLMSEQITNVINVVVDHSWSFKTQTPRNDRDILGQAHWLQHLRTEDTRVTNLDPLFQLRVIAKDFKTRLRVRVVRRLILQVLDSNLGEEGLHDAEQVVQADAFVDDNALNLMELSQVSGIKRLISEDTIDREVLHWLELLLLCLLEEHLRADCCSVSPQDVLHCLFRAPAWTVADRSWQTVLMHFSHALFVLFGNTIAGDWIFGEEGVLKVASGMTLGLEKRVEVPE